MTFQPSPYSFPAYPSSVSVEEYGGWLRNVWTREGRAENKLKRAKRKKKRGRTKGAERLERRAGILKAKARGKAGSLGPQSSYTALWASKFPWAERRHMAGSGITGAARGYRPSRGAARGEWRATILGGITALKAAGVPGYIDVQVEALPQTMKQSEEKDKRLIQAVSATTGTKIKSIRQAAGVVRAAVVRRGLEEVAWPARAIPMLGAGQKRAAITGGAAGTAVPVLHASAAAATATVIGIPVAIVLEGVAWAATGLAAGAGVKSTVAKSQSAKYQQELAANLEKWAAENQKSGVLRQLQDSRARFAYQEKIAQRVGEIKGRGMAQAVTVLAWAGGISVAILATSAVIGRTRSQT